MDVAILIAATVVLMCPSPASVPVYIISLSHRGDRLKACLARHHHIVHPRVIEGVNGSTLTVPIPEKLTRGEVGCFMSHIKALRAIASSSAPYALVLEDDVILSFPECLAWIDKLPADWEVLSLGCNWEPETNDQVAPGLVRMNAQPLYGTQAILYSKAGARRIAERAMATGVSEAYDIWLPKSVPHLQMYVNVPSQAGIVDVYDTDTQRLR